MCRRVLTALAFLIALAPMTVAAPASADPRPLTRIPGWSEFAIAGEQVLVTRMRFDGPNVRVFAIPVAGGAARQVFSFDAPEGMRIQEADLSASAQWAAVEVGMGREGRDDYLSVLRDFAGPVAGGWSELQPLAGLRPRPFGLQVDGDRVFTLASRAEPEDLRVVVRDPEPYVVALPSDEDALLARFAGDLVAYRAGGSFDGRTLGHVLTVRDWRTGAVISSADLPEEISWIALHPSGRAAAVTVDEQLYELRPGSVPRLLNRHGGRVAYAGDSLVQSSGDGLRVIDGSGRSRRFGAPTARLTDFATEGSRVVWEANGCLLVDDVSAPPATAPGPGPCPRSELALPAQPRPHLARAFPLRLRCLAAPRTCRGALRLKTADDPETLIHAQAISPQVRFSIPAGHTRRLRVPLTGNGYRILRRELARDKADSKPTRQAFVVLDARTEDGGRFPGEAQLDGVPEHDGVLFLALGPNVAAPKGSPPAVRRVYADYAENGRVDVCEPSLRTLKRTLATIDRKVDRDYPDFRAAIEAGIRRYRHCNDHP